MAVGRREEALQDPLGVGVVAPAHGGGGGGDGLEGQVGEAAPERPVDGVARHLEPLLARLEDLLEHGVGLGCVRQLRLLALLEDHLDDGGHDALPHLPKWTHQ